MSGLLTYPGTPRYRKRMSTRRLLCLGLGILLCVFTGYQIAPYKHPSRKFARVDHAGPGSNAPVAALVGRNDLAESRTVTPMSTQPEVFISTAQSVDGVQSRIERKHTTKGADDPELRQSDFCSNNCNSSDIYRRLWLAARIGENTRIFQPSVEADDPYRESIETNVVTKDFRVVIKVLAFNRLESLTRCLLSLAKADYGGDSVNIQIFIDHFRYEETRRVENSKNTAAASGKADNSEREAPSSGSREKSKVESRGKRLLWSFFNRAPVEASRDSEEARESSDSRPQMFGKFATDSGKTKGHEEQDTLGAQNSVDAQHERQGIWNDDFVAPRRFEMKSSNEQLEEAHAILSFVDNFWWSHGTKEIHYRSQNVGLQAQWIESWWPANLDEFAFIVEDDMEVSNLYYRFLRTVIATYYYNPEQYDPSVYGVSLQRPRFVPGKGGLPLKLNTTTNLFMYPLIGTWGQLLFPKQWKEFRLWYDNRKSKGEKPVLEGMITNSWYTKLGERIWTPWFVKFAQTRGYFNLYTNFVDERALSVSHREPGVSYKNAAGADSQLLNTKEEGNDTMLWVMSPSKALPHFDFCFRDVKIQQLAKTQTALRSMLASTERKNAILLVNIIDVHSALVRNWLCLMERLGMRQFVLLGDDDDLTSDLARRGYAIVSSELFTQPAQAATRGRRDTIAAQAVLEILNLGHNVWLTRADTVWLQNPVDSGVDTTGSDVMGSQPFDEFHPALVYIRTSHGVLRLWSQWIGNMSVVSSSGKSSSSGSHSSSAWPGFHDFVTTNTKCQYVAMPSNLSGSFRDLQSSKTNTLASGKKLILLNRLQGRNLPFVVKTLKGAGLWAIDKDFACKRVYC